MLDATAAWALHPAVSVRPEPFGALLYHFGNRRLSFLKDRVLLDIVNGLGEHDSLDAVLAASGVAGADKAKYLRAIETLVGSDIVVRRQIDPAPAKETA